MMKRIRRRGRRKEKMNIRRRKIIRYTIFRTDSYVFRFILIGCV